MTQPPPEPPPARGRLAAFAAGYPVWRRIALYGASRGLTEVLLGLRGVLLATILGPEAFGAWALFRLAARYAGIGALGVHRGLEYETVRALAEPGPDGKAEAERAGKAALAYIYLVFGLLAVLGLAASVAVSDRGLAAGLQAFALGTLAEQVWIVLAVNLRARGELRRYAANEVLNALLHLLLSGFLAASLALTGAFLGFVIASTMSVLLLVRYLSLRPRWSAERLRRLLRVGLPIALVLVAGLVLSTVDRFVVVAFGGTALLGLYAFAVAIATLANTAAWVVRTVVFPAVYRRAARDGTGTAIRNHFRDALLPFGLLVPPLLGVAGIVLGPAIVLLLPQYLEALLPARIFIFTGVATGLTSLATIAVVAADRQRLLPVSAVAAAGINVGLAILALTSGLGLPGVALAALVSQTVYAGAALGIMVGGRRSGIPQPARAVARALGPTLWCAAAVLAVQRITPMTTPASVLAGLGLYSIALVPLLPAILRLGRRLTEAAAGGPESSSGPNLAEGAVSE